MSNEHDDLDAVRTIVDTLTQFDTEEQQRIVRWAFEKIGLAIPEVSISEVQSNQERNATVDKAETPRPETDTRPADKTDIRSFIKLKRPTSDMQFAATAAYYYAFEAPEADKCDEIDSELLQESCRLADRERLQNPGQTLRNAAFNGLLDKGSSKGSFRINTVGENLVALTLPAGDGAKPIPTKRKKKKIPAKAKSKKPAPRKPASKAKKKKSAPASKKP